MSSLRAPMRRESERHKALRPAHDKSRAAVMARCLHQGHLVCEGCGRIDRLEWSHQMGRGSRGIPEPYCSMAELCAGLCPLCHRAIDGDIGGTDINLRSRLQQTALCRFAMRFKREISVDDLSEPLGAVRRIVAELEWEASGGDDTKD